MPVPTYNPVHPRPSPIVVLCEYMKFLIEYLKRVQLFEICEYLPSPISYLKKHNNKASFLTE